MSPEVLKQIASRLQAEAIPFLAAAIAYYAFVSLLPGIVLVFAIASLIGHDAIATTIITQSSGLLSDAGKQLVRDMATSSQGRTGATIVGIALLGWSTLRVFRGLDIAFSQIYGTMGEQTIVNQLRDGITVIITVGLAIWLMVIIGGILAAIEIPLGGDIFGLLLLFLALTVIFLPLYTVFPDVELRIKEAVPGASLAAGSWVGLQIGFQFYASQAGNFDVYGVLGGVMLIVTWFYLGAILLMVGAVLNVVLSDRTNRQGQEATSLKEI